MSVNVMLFVVFPYAAVAMAAVGTVYRFLARPSTVSSRSSQLLESKKLFWGSVPFHWGLALVLAGHLAALLVPRGVELWNGAPVRLFLLEASGLALGLWSLGGLAVLCWRRASEARVRAVTSVMDVATLGGLAVSMLSGIAVALVYGSGAFWFTSVLTPYIWSLAGHDPRPELIADLPLLVQLHVFNFFLLLALLPFSRLVHAISLPLGYLIRPPLLVLRTRRQQEPPLAAARDLPVSQVRR
jgi:nitrate reductase gamma subunit